MAHSIDEDANRLARKEAKEAGRKTYVCATPCRYCDSNVRYTSNALCTECDKIKKAARLVDPEKAAAARASAAARVARYRAKQKQQGARLESIEKRESDDFADILG